MFTATSRPLHRAFALLLTLTAAACGNDVSSASGGDASGATTDATQADGALATGDGAAADSSGGGSDAPTSDPGAPTLILKVAGADRGCAIAEAELPPAGTLITFAFARNGGPFEALAAAEATSAPLPAAFLGCDVVQCRAEVALASGSVTAFAGPAQLPMAGACGAGCWTCHVGGGCKAATDTCDDGDACTTGDSCSGGSCKGTPVAGATWFVDQDGDGFGGATFTANACGIPDAAARAAFTYTQKGGDCDDDNAAVHPGAAEACDGIDSDCSGGGDADLCAADLPTGTKDFTTDAPMTGDSFEVGATATVDAGPLGDVKLEGTVKKDGKDAPITYCLSGPVQSDAPPVGIEDGTLEVCKDASGKVTATLAATLVVEDAKGKASCAVDVGPDGKLDCTTETLDLLGLPTAGARLGWGKGDGAVDVQDAKASLDYLGQAVPLTLSGALVPGKDTALDLQLDAPEAVLLLGTAAAATASSGVGKRARAGGAITTTLDLLGKDAALLADPKASAGSLTVAASQQDKGPWKVALKLQDAALGPFAALTAEGEGTQDSGGELTVCASGAIGVTAPGADAPASAALCFTTGKDATASLATTIAMPLFGTVAVSGSWAAGASEVCLQGETGKSLPALDGGAATPLLAETCLDLASKTFGSPTVRTKAALGPLGEVELQGTAAEGALCLTGQATLPIAGQPLQLVAKGCTDASFGALQASATATIAMPPFGEVSAVATLGGTPGEVCFTATVPAKLGFAASDVQLVAEHCVAVGKNDAGETTASFSQGPKATLTLTHPELGAFVLTGVWDADKVGNGGSKGVLCVHGALPDKATALLPLPGATVLGVQGTTCFGKDGFEGLGLSSVLRLGDATDPAAVWLLAEGGLDAAGGACKAKPATAAECVAAQDAYSKSSDDPSQTQDARYAWLGSTCYDVQSTDAASCKQGGGSWKTDVAGRLALGLAPFCQKAGSDVCAYSSSCDVAAGDAVCGQKWRPFAGISGAPAAVQGLTMLQLQGYLLADKEKATLGLRAEAGFAGGAGTLTLLESGGAPLLELEKVGVAAQVDSKGQFAVALAGETKLGLGAVGFPAWDLRALLRAEVDNDGAAFFGRVLPTSCDGKGVCAFPALEPFEPLVGKGAFAVQSKGAQLAFAVKWAAGKDAGLLLQLQTAGSVELLGNAKADVSVNVRAAWPKASGGGKAKPVLTLAAILQKFEVKAGDLVLELGEVKGGAGAEIKPIVLLASSDKVAEMPIDADGDLSNGAEQTWEIPKGLTLRTAAEITHLEKFFTKVTAQLDLTIQGASQFHIHGLIELPWDLIKPEYGIPTLHSAGLDSFYVDIDVSTAVVLKLGGKANVVTLDRLGGKHPLQGMAEFEIDSTGGIGGTLALTGLWQEPFFVPNLAVMDMGVKLKLRPGSPPTPVAFGFTGTGLLHKADFDAPWPKIAKDAQNNPVGVNPDGSLMPQLPSTVLSIGNSFSLDTTPTASGFCVGPACVPMPSLLVRIDRQNLSTDDIVWAVGQLQKGLGTMIQMTKQMQVLDPTTGELKIVKDPFGPIAERFPLDKAVNVQIPSTVKLDLKRALVYLSTHDQSLFGLDWPFGFRMELDAAMVVPAGKEAGTTKKLRLSGALDTSGLELHGRMSPLQVIEGIDLVADPFRKVAQLGGGTLALPASLGAASAGTVELAVLGPAKGGAVLLETAAGGRKVRLAETATLYPICEAGGELAPTAADGSALDCKLQAPALELTLVTDDAAIPAAQRTRVVRSRRGIRTAGVWQRLAYTVDGKGRVTLYEGGKSVALVDSADGADGEAGTDDDLARFAAPAIAAATTAGGPGVTALDDLRFWKVVRAPEAIARTLERPLKGAHNDADLLGWYEVDFDETFDKAGGAVVLHNSRLVSGRDGSYQGGAKPAIDSEDQDLRVDLSLPILDPLAAGMGFDAGLALLMPPPLDQIMGTAKVAFAARMHASAKKLEAQLYTRKLNIVPIPTIGGFVLTGDGPNGASGDFDDGLWLQASFAPALDTSSDHLPMIDASARLRLDWNELELPIGQVTTRLGCLAKDGKGGAAFTGKACKLGAGYHLFTETKLGADGALSLPLGGKDKLTLKGKFLATTLDAPFRLVATSGLSAYGRVLNEQTLLIDGKGISATGEFDLGNIAGVDFGAAASLGVTFGWQPLRLCGVGKTAVEVVQLATFAGDVEACFGTNPFAKFSGTAKTGALGATGIPVTDLAATLDSSKGLLLDKARLVVPALYDGQLKGFYKTATNFALAGSSVVSPGPLVTLTTSASVQRNGSAGGGSLSAKLDTSKSGNWASGTVAGSFETASGKLYWGLAGNATLSPVGFKLASGRFWACNPKSLAAAGLPAECKVAGNAGFGASGQVDLGFAKASVLGKLSFGNKAGSVSYDHLDLTGTVNTKLFNVFTANLTAHHQLSKPVQSGKNGLRLDGKLSFWGIAPTVSATLTAGADGRPTQVALTGKGNFKPYPALTLTSGSATYTWKPTGATANASGNVSIPSVLSTKVSSNISSSGSFSFKGTTNVKIANLMQANSSITLSSSGAAINTSMVADTKDVDLYGNLIGTVPYNGAFSFTGSGGIKLGAFPKANGNFSAHYSKGVAGSAAVDIKVTKITVGASATPGATGITVSGKQDYNWTIGNFNFPYVTEAVKYVASALSGWSCSTYCVESVLGQCVLYWFKCTKKTTHDDYKSVGAKVTFNLSGTSYVSSSTVKLGATATLNVGPVKGSSSTTCGIGTSPQCCFSFPSPVGKQCLKLY